MVCNTIRGGPTPPLHFIIDVVPAREGTLASQGLTMDALDGLEGEERQDGKEDAVIQDGQDGVG